MDENRTNPELPTPDDSAHADGEGDDLTSELVAFLDGELDAPGNEAVEAKISLDSTVRAEADALKRAWDLLDYLPRPEPTANFTERTVSRIEPVRQSGKTLPVSGPASVATNGSASAGTESRSSRSRPAGAATQVLEPRARSGRWRLVVALAWLFAVGLAGFAGYFGRAKVVDHFNHVEQQEKDAAILTERRLLQDLHSFQYVDDLEFLQALDNPDLFGEELYFASPNEGPP
jgi:hypothetical protein